MLCESNVKSMAHLNGLLGDKLLDSKTSTLCEIDQLNGKTIGLYFSASWCDRCRKVTKRFSEAYNNATAENQHLSFDVVLLSLDDDEELFRESYQQMPWKAVPFTDDEKSEALMRRYGVDDIPSVVILKPDGELLAVVNNEELESETYAISLLMQSQSGFWIPEAGEQNEYIWKSKHCHSCFMKPLAGERFHCTSVECGIDLCQNCFQKRIHDHTLTQCLIPTKCYSIEQLLENSHLMIKNEESYSIETMKNKYLGIYFSAVWSESDENFTEKLADVYQNATSINLCFDIVFISADDNLTSFRKHIHLMPWKILQFDDQSTRFRLKVYYQIQEVPTLVIIKPNGELLTKSGRRDIDQKGIAAVKTWCKGETIDYVSDEFIWFSVTCGGCGVTPVVGPRFHCSTCIDYDLCFNCSRKGHQHELNLIENHS